MMLDSVCCQHEHFPPSEPLGCSVRRLDGSPYWIPDPILSGSRSPGWAAKVSFENYKS